MIDLIAVKRIELNKSEPIELFKDSTGSADSDFFRLLNDNIKNEDNVQEDCDNEEESHLVVREKNNLQGEGENDNQLITKPFDIINEIVNLTQEGNENKSELKLEKVENENINLIGLNIKGEVKTDEAPAKIEANIEKLQELLLALDTQNIKPTEAENIIASIKEFLVSPEAANLPDKSKKSLSQLIVALENKLQSAAQKESFILPDKIDLKQIVADINKNITNNQKTKKQAPNEKIEIQTASYKIELLKESNIELPQIVAKQDISENKKPDVLFSNNRNTSVFENRSILNGQNQQRNDFNQSREFREQISALLEKGKIKIKDAKNASFEIKLNPKELGSLNMNIGIEKGILTGRFLVETEQAKNLLMENLLHIKTQLEESGVAIGDFHVNVRKQNRDDSEDIAFKTARVLTTSPQVGAVVDYNSISVHDGSLNLVI